MSIKARLAKLGRRPDGRCPLCRDRPGDYRLRIVYHVVESPADRAALGPPQGAPPELTPCPRCGWKPSVVAIVKVVVSDRGEARSVQES
jgi:hypothetical protein